MSVVVKASSNASRRVIHTFSKLFKIYETWVALLFLEQQFSSHSVLSPRLRLSADGSNATDGFIATNEDCL